MLLLLFEYSGIFTFYPLFVSEIANCDGWSDGKCVGMKPKVAVRLVHMGEGFRGASGRYLK